MKFLGLLVVGVCLAAAVSGQSGTLVSQEANDALAGNTWQIPGQSLDPHSTAFNSPVGTIGSSLNNAFNSGLNTVGNQFNSELNPLNNQLYSGPTTLASQSFNPLQPGATTTSFRTLNGLNAFNTMTTPTFGQNAFNAASLFPSTATVNTFSSVPASSTFLNQFSSPLTTQLANPVSFSLDAGMPMTPTFMSPMSAPPMDPSMFYNTPNTLNTFQPSIFHMGSTQYFNDPFNMNMYMPSASMFSMDPGFTTFNQGITGMNDNVPISGEQVFCIPPSKIPHQMRAALMSLK
ncbi:uncharacterized protein [Argopecten irradians]|uniref:uncharacterized protein n=1 Tax=Argopecten irradians TaxID=31199 RepID=UPI0037107410